MAARGLFSSPSTALFLLLLFFVGTSVEGVLFSKLPRTLIVSASPKQGQGMKETTIPSTCYDNGLIVLKAGEDTFTISWVLNQSEPAGTDSSYKKVKLRLCYAPVSQKDRGWRKTVDDLKKDKTCQFGITIKPYTKSNTTYDYMIERDVPTATYFIRAYLLDSGDTEVAFGETTDEHKTTNLFQITGITGRTASLDIAAGCFSAFSVVSLLFFFVKEKRKGNK